MVTELKVFGEPANFDASGDQVTPWRLVQYGQSAFIVSRTDLFACLKGGDYSCKITFALRITNRIDFRLIQGDCRFFNLSSLLRFPSTLQALVS